MKTIFHAGQTIRACCPQCDAIRTATYTYGDFPFDNGVTAKNILRAVCNECHAVVAVAHQSAPLLKQALATARKATTVRLPRELLDFVSVQLDQAGAPAKQYDLFIRALLLTIRGKEAKLGPQLRKVSDPILEQAHSAVLHLTLNQALQEALDKLREYAQLSNVSDVLRRLIVLVEGSSMGKTVSKQTQHLALALA